MIEIKSSTERPFSGSEWRIRFSGCRGALGPQQARRELVAVQYEADRRARRTGSRRRHRSYVRGCAADRSCPADEAT